MREPTRRLLLVGVPRSGASVVAQAFRTVLPDGSVAVEWDARQLPPTVDDVDAATHIVLVVRNPVAVISSLVNAWGSRRFTTDRPLDGWWGDPWAFAVIPDWQQLIGQPTMSICVAQWAAYTERVTSLLEHLPTGRWSAVPYEDFMASPRSTLASVLDDAGLAADVPAHLHLADTGTAVTRAGQQHWAARRHEIEVGLQGHDAISTRLLDVVRHKVDDFGWPALPSTPTQARTMRKSADTPFESHFTASVPRILQQARRSLAISTYKSGHVIIARAANDQLDTEFINVPRAMGIAVAGNRLALGANTSIKSFAATASLAPKITSPVPIDSVYTPRSETHTGDIAIHDMAYDRCGDLYFVNTKFSCLCVQDLHHSFVPVWRPWWITALAPEDRCHLNGLALVDGVPRYVTVLARTDSPGGWREHRGTGGTLIDVTSDEVVAEGLSMPHSPRWHDGSLWVLESGKGALGKVDLDSGTVTEVARVPGFTRGMAFIGKYAFIGLSQVRESVFAGLPVTETAAERNCGVWVVDTEAGTIAGMLKFNGAVQELFEVAVLPAAWPTVIGPNELAAQNYVLPEAAIRDVPEALRSNR